MYLIKKLDEKVDSIYVHHMVETNGLATIGQLSFGSLVRASSPVVCSIETYEDGAYKHLRFTRPARENAGEPEEKDSKRWPRLRLALQKAGVAPLHFIGGFRCVPLYEDELAINDYSASGSSGWIVRSRDIPRLLETVPLDEKGLEQQRKKVAWLEGLIKIRKSDLSWFEKELQTDPYVIRETQLLKEQLERLYLSLKKAQRGLIRK